ncbi:hypothetical protein B0H16DRAFT_1887198 [Mycena metata]|uniref:MYND-type domain-containing protein n=1 Tax=Mycena metata TaxID=1033252 RepID=A0AAD7IXQ2_9AGAR|nr:hypothetical protein B0H16DRAFT_1887198 [Mycena metata]
MSPPTDGVGLSCHKCGKMEMLDPVRDGRATMAAAAHLVCGGCRRVYYCSEACQKAHWNRHKALCKVLRKIEKDFETADDLAKAFDRPVPTTIDPVIINKISVSHHQRLMNLCEAGLGRELNDDECTIVACEPKCLACARTGLILRVEARNSGPNARVTALKPCPECKMAFYCSDAHWDAARALHITPCADLPEGVSQCEMNIQLRRNAEFQGVMTAPRLRASMWQFMPREEVWIALQGQTWEDILRRGMDNSPVGSILGPIFTPPCVRTVSSLATTVMTALYALEQLNPDTAWTSKSTITIHILGALPDFSPDIAFMYEAILHRLPHIIFCSPAVATFVPLPAWVNKLVREHEPCSSCSSLHARTITHQHVTKYYDDYIRGEGASFEPPDLAIVTNPFLAASDQTGWRRVIKTLTTYHIPSIFTASLLAYEQRAAEQDMTFIRENCGSVEFIPSLTMVKNPWASLVMHPNSQSVYGFHSPNGGLTAGFR